MIWYHGTTHENWKKIQDEGVLFGVRKIAKCRCTYLTRYIDEAKQYGDIILEVRYEPCDDTGNVKRDEFGPLNNYCEDCWQIRVYEPIDIENITLINHTNHG